MRIKRSTQIFTVLSVLFLAAAAVSVFTGMAGAKTSEMLGVPFDVPTEIEEVRDFLRRISEVLGVA